MLTIVLAERDNARLLGRYRDFDQLGVVDVFLDEYCAFHQLAATPADEDIRLPDLDADFVLAFVLIGDLQGIECPVARPDVIEAAGEGHQVQGIRTGRDVYVG